MKTTTQTLETLNRENALLAKMTRAALKDHSKFATMQAQHKIAMAAYREHWALVDGFESYAAQVASRKVQTVNA